MTMKHQSAAVRTALCDLKHPAELSLSCVTLSAAAKQLGRGDHLHRAEDQPGTVAAPRDRPPPGPPSTMTSSPMVVATSCPPSATCSGPSLVVGHARRPAGSCAETPMRPISEGAGHEQVVELAGDMGRECSSDERCEAAGWSDRSLAGVCGGTRAVRSHRGGR
eukprot:SAG22_NODE_955_length_6331_cov_21.329108_4_plen_164_part_00